MTLRGTALYLAPETILNGKYSIKTDIFALGISICELFTEEIPYSNQLEENAARLMVRIAIDNIRPDRPKHPHTIVPLIDRCLETDPKDRPSCADLDLQLKKIAISSNF